MLQNYLREGYCTIKYNGKSYGKFSAASGVPQGSNLEPILFLLSTNVLPKLIKLSEDCLLFAHNL